MQQQIDDLKDRNAELVKRVARVQISKQIELT
jgi:hypothetical protein